MKNIIVISFLFIGCGKNLSSYTTYNYAIPIQPTTVPQSTTYIGCFSDTGTRALPNFLIQTGATVETCVAAAKAGGYTFAGVQYGGQCFAGDVLGYAQGTAQDCNMPCSANSNEICGGTWYNSIYLAQ